MNISWCWKAASRSLQGRDLGATRNQGYQDLSPTGHQALPSHVEPNASSWWDVPSVRRRRGGETKAHLLGVSLCPKVRVECGRHLPLVAALGVQDLFSEGLLPPPSIPDPKPAAPCSLGFVKSSVTLSGSRRRGTSERPESKSHDFFPPAP